MIFNHQYFLGTEQNLLVAKWHPDKDCHEDKSQTGEKEEFIRLKINNDDPLKEVNVMSLLVLVTLPRMLSSQQCQ